MRNNNKREALDNYIVHVRESNESLKFERSGPRFSMIESIIEIPLIFITGERIFTRRSYTADNHVKNAKRKKLSADVQSEPSNRKVEMVIIFVFVVRVPIK